MLVLKSLPPSWACAAAGEVGSVVCQKPPAPGSPLAKDKTQLAERHVEVGTTLEPLS